MSALAVATVDVPAVDRLAPVIQLRPRRRRHRRIVAELVCARCGATFGAKQKRASYCSSPCRQAAYRARHSTNGGPPQEPAGLTLDELLARNPHVRKPEQLETLLADLARTGLVERLGDRWRLTETARREYGWALDLLEEPA